VSESIFPFRFSNGNSIDGLGCYQTLMIGFVHWPLCRERGRPVRTAPQALNLFDRVIFALRAQCGRDVRAPSDKVIELFDNTLTQGVVRG
jgi:hypothetical protein